MNLLSGLFGGSSAATLSAGDLKARIDAKDVPYLVDVRQPDEFAGGHIPGAKLIPLDQLAARLDELPKDREIVCVCRSGNRSGAATRQLTRAGYRAANLRGGMMDWQRAGFPVRKGR